MISKKCIIHNASVIFQNPSQSDPKQRNLCKLCIVQMGNDLVLFEDRQKELKRQQTEIIQEKEQEFANCYSILQQIRIDILSYKSQVENQIQKFLCYIDQQIDLIQIQMGKFSNQISKISLVDSQLFTSSCQEVLNDYPNYNIIKNNIQIRLSKLNSQEFMKNLEEKINKLSLDSQLHQNDIPPNLVQLDQEKKSYVNLQCEIHKSSIVMVDLNEKSTLQNRLACLSCVEQYPIKFTRIQRVFELQSIYYQNQMKSIDMKIQMLNQEQEKQNKLLDDVEFQISRLIKQYKNEQNKEINIYLEQMGQLKNETQAKWSDYTQQGIIDIVNIISKSNYIEQFNDKLQENYQNLKEIQIINLNCFTSNFLNILKEIQPVNQQLFEQQINDNIEGKVESNSKATNQSIQKQEQKISQKAAKYELLQQYSIKQFEVCHALAFNKDSSILIVACKKKIQIFSQKNGKLQVIQVISQHTGDVYCLTFLKKTNSFISGSQDQSIKIWERKKGNNQWICQQNLDLHTNSIFCLISKKTEDFIISGSADTTIKFWGIQKYWICVQTIKIHTNTVYSLSLNEKQDILISCGRDNRILVINQEYENWIVCQTIMVEQFGLRACFIKDNAFSFQPRNLNKLYIYEMNDTEFIKTKEVEVYNGKDCDCLFPSQYIQQKQMLVSKNGSNLNFISINANSECILEFSIEFNCPKLYGTLSNDGEFLITWDEKQKEIQVRKYIL